MFNTLGVEYDGELTPTDIRAGWTDGRPVKFFPVLHDEYPARNGPSDLLPAERVLSPDDYHPFLHVATLAERIFAEAGYRVESRFFASEFFRRGGSPHGLLGPPDHPRHGEGQRGGEGRRRPRDRAQLGGQHRRDGHAAEHRRRRKPHRRTVQSRGMLLDGRRPHPIRCPPGRPASGRRSRAGACTRIGTGRRLRSALGSARARGASRSVRCLGPCLPCS